MTLFANLYKFQFFAFLAIVGVLTMQFELLMLDRGVALTISLIVFSIGQISNIATVLMLRRFSDKVKDKNLIIQISLIARTIIVGAMFFTANPILFSILYLLYIISSAVNILFEGLVAQWSFDNSIKFPRVRFFGSVGFAAAGFIVSFIFDQTGILNNILLFIFLLNIFTTIVAFVAPIKTNPPKKESEAPTNIPNIYRFMLLLVAVIFAFPNAFSIVLNNHFREIFYLSIEEAIFYASLSVFFGSFIAEFIGFFSVDRLMRKLNSKNVVLLGMCLSLIRWVLSLLAVNELMFALVFILHGLGFVFIYIGAIGYVKDKIGNQNTTNMLMEFVLLSGIMSLVMIQITNGILNFFSSNTLISIFIIINLIVTITYYYTFYIKYDKL